MKVITVFYRKDGKKRKSVRFQKITMSIEVNLKWVLLDISDYNTCEDVRTLNVGSARVGNRDGCISLHEKKSNRDACSTNVMDKRTALQYCKNSDKYIV